MLKTLRSGLMPPRKRGNLNIVQRDPYFHNVVLYLKGDGTNDSVAIIDSSLVSNVITVSGGVQISTAQSKYGGSSLYFDGSGYVSFPDVGLLGLDWTIETWFFCPSLASYQPLLAKGVSDTNEDFLWLVYSSDVYLDFASTGNLGIYKSFGGFLAANRWNHVAIVRSGSTFTSYINGVLTGTALTSTAAVTSVHPTFEIGISRGGINFFTGYIDSFRITKGIVRYVVNFNPETDTYLT